MKKKEKDLQESKALTVKKERKSGLGKILRKTSLTVLLILIILTACIGINMLVEEKNIADFDFTEDKIYSLSDMSKQIAEEVKNNVEIILINMPEAQQDFAYKYNSVNVYDKTNYGGSYTVTFNNKVGYEGKTGVQDPIKHDGSITPIL